MVDRGNAIAMAEYSGSTKTSVDDLVSGSVRAVELDSGLVATVEGDSSLAGNSHVVLTSAPVGVIESD